MRRLVVCLFAIITLAACGATTDSGGGADGGTTNPDVTDSSDTVPPPPLGCDNAGECSSDTPCMVGSCDPATGGCVFEPAEDGTDCVVNDTDSVCVEGSCLESVCGDDVCEGAEDVDNCADDCLVEGCKDDEVAGCAVDSCVAAELLGDGSCDTDLDCEETDWDDGDCLADPCGDGVCADDEDAESCPADCEVAGCLDGEVLACDGETCVAESLLGDLSCDTDLACEETGWDGGDCEAPEPCGDEVCDADAGEDVDTCPEDCTPACADGEVKDCEWVSCVSDSWLGDGTCDDLLNCDELAYDNGDCDQPGVCGNDLPATITADECVPGVGARPVGQLDGAGP